MRYRISATCTISISTVVEADSAEEAKRIAEDRAMCPIGSPDNYGTSDEECWCHSGELDGTPEGLEVKEE